MPWVSQKASWIGDNSPGPGVTPSMVMTGVPAACAANIRQERTVTPSNSTVQAPHTPCSQPACAPLRSSRSRRQSSKVVRGSTSISCSVPLTLSSMRIRVPLGFFPLRVADGIRNGAAGEIDRGAAAVLGRGVQIGQRIDIGEGPAQRRVHCLGIECGAYELLLRAIEPHGEIGDRADADGDAFTLAVGAQLDLRRRRHEGEVAAPRVHFVKSDADLFTLPNRETHAD